MLRKVLFAMFLYLPAMSMAQEIIEPFCDIYVAQRAVEALQIAGYLNYEEIVEAKVIGFKELGIAHFDEEFEDTDNILYQIVLYLKIQDEDNHTYELVAIDDVSTGECSMTGRPLVILTSPKHRVIGNWGSYLQFKEAVRQNPNKPYAIPTPNLIK